MFNICYLVVIVQAIVRAMKTSTKQNLSTRRLVTMSSEMANKPNLKNI